MFQQSKLTHAILVALAASAPGYALAQDASEEANDENTRAVETIEVTATKRTTNIQQTPTAVQALSEKELRDQNIGNFEDYIQYVPNVSAGGRGPGQNDVFIRGMSIQPITVMLSGAQGTMPNVALYVDEMPVTAPGRNLDVYAADLQRIEVLPGPQGTLFGASSQAGTIRYITKKPVLGFTEAGFKAGFEMMPEGEMSNVTEAFLNVPVGDDMAVRAVVYNVNRGGYIDNVYGEFTLDPAINPNSAVNYGPDAKYETAYNTNLIEEDFNDSYYRGFRLSARYQINLDWELLVQHQSQDLGADGVFDYDPEVGDLQVQRFYPDQLEDSFGLTSWTLDGRLGDLEVVYTGGYLQREVEQSIDYTGYNNTGAFIGYYTCTYTNPDYIDNYGINPDVITDVRECLDPTKGFEGYQEHTRFTQEFRINYDFNDSSRVTAGVFYDDYEIETQDDYVYFNDPDRLGFAPNAPLPDANNINPNTRPPGVAFFNDITRTESQIAVFGEYTYDFTEQWSATVGLRWYDMESDYTGSSNFAAGIFNGSVDHDAGRDYDVSGGHTPEPLKLDGVIPKLTVSYQMDSSKLFYATYSEGFRPGGFNRGGGLPSANPEFPTVETTYETDDVVNYEFGWKTLLLDNTLRWNGNVYFIDWTDMQVSRFDPQNVSILTFIENAADSEIRGIESDFTWRATDNWTLMGAFSYNDTELVATNANVIEMAPVGSELPLTPKFQANFRARYDWRLDNNMDAHVQLGWLHAGKAYSSIVAADRLEQDAYDILNASVGVATGQWSAKLYINNLTDERAQMFINDMDDIPRISTNRPMTVGLAFSYNFF